MRFVAAFFIALLLLPVTPACADDAPDIPGLTAKAEQGDADAQHDLGKLYADGKGVPQDNAQAMKWWQKAAAQGDARSQNNIGVNYEFGRGVPQDYAEAAKWIGKAAEQGQPIAQDNFGLMYQRGWGVPQDNAEAFKWFSRAAEQGNTHAQSSVGYLYANGLGVKQDYAEALKWYHRAADRGDASAQTGLGYLYDVGHGVPQDYAEAAKWYHEAAEQGDKQAQHNLGILYDNGRGVRQDNAEASKWYNKAAAQGLPKLQETSRSRPFDFAPFIFLLFALIPALAVRGRDRGRFIGALQMRQVDGKLDALLKNAGVRYDPGADLDGDILYIAFNSGKIDAIKYHRGKTGMGLADSKRYVEDLMQHSTAGSGGTPGINSKDGVRLGQLLGIRDLNKKLDALLKNAGVAYDPCADADSDVLVAALNGNVIEAIKLQRTKTGMSLADSKNYVEGLMLRSRAERGETSALVLMGDRYLKGRGVPQNDQEAYFWFSLAARSGLEKVAAARDTVAARLSPEQISSVEKRVREWKLPPETPPAPPFPG